MTSGPGLHLYAHGLRNVPGGVAMLVINTDRQNRRTLTLAVTANRYTLTAAKLRDKRVLLNRSPLRLGANDALPVMAGQATAAGRLTFAPVSITFLAAPSAQNQGCR